MFIDVVKVVGSFFFLHYMHALDVVPLIVREVIEICNLGNMFPSFFSISLFDFAFVWVF